ncbi:MAG: PocR ligand-binding domain-containing protein, partial [Vampirovibrionia bacterium]
MQYQITDLIDIESFKLTCELFAKLTGYTVSMGSHPDQTKFFLVSSKGICRDFHRKNARTSNFCVKSNLKLTEGLTKPGQIAISYCANGLIDGATPVFVDGQHLANLFAGQVFFTEPDIPFFERQAKKYGFDKDEYLDALSKVPIVKEKDFKLCLTYLANMASCLATVGIMNKDLKDKEAILKKTNFTLMLQQRSLLDSSPNIVSLKYFNGNYLLVNKAFSSFCNIKSNELDGKTDFDCFTDDVAAKLKKMDKQVIENKKQEVFELKLKSINNGNKMITETYKSPVYDDNDEFLGILSISNDITRQKNIEKALKQSEERYKGLFSN